MGGGSSGWGGGLGRGDSWDAGGGGVSRGLSYGPSTMCQQASALPQQQQRQQRQQVTEEYYRGSAQREHPTGVVRAPVGGGGADAGVFVPGWHEQREQQREARVVTENAYARAAEMRKILPPNNTFPAAILRDEKENAVTLPAEAVEAEGPSKEGGTATGPETPEVSEARDLHELKVAELKAILRTKNLKVSGRRAELIERLEQAGVAQGDGVAVAALPIGEAGEPSEASSAIPEVSKVEDFNKYKVAELKGFLRERNLKVSGIRAELIERLEQASKSETPPSPPNINESPAAARTATPVADVNRAESLPPAPAPETTPASAIGIGIGMNWDEANSYVGDGEDLLVAPDMTWRVPDNYGNGRGGGGGGGAAYYTNGGNRAMDQRNGYPRPPPAAAAATAAAAAGYGGTAAAAVATPSAAQRPPPGAVNGYAAPAASPSTERLPLPSMPRTTVAAPKGDPGIAELSLPSMPRTVDDRVEGVQVVAGRENARKVVEILMANPDAFYACDTEVSEVDLARHGPVGHGRVTCISVYGGPDLDFGEGPGKILWVDNLGEASGTLEEFVPFFASEKHKKVWHNYGFDRHVLFNSPDGREEQRINCLGFGGDTMHMARLWDTSMEKAAGETGFSLEALSLKLLGEEQRKTPMKQLFGVPKMKKDGTPGSMLVLPPIDEIQTNPTMRARFIEYSAYDAQATWLVHRSLMQKLREMPWKDGMTMLDFYEKYYVPFGELLTDMERTGIYVEAKGYLKDVEVQAREDKKKAEETFLNWVKRMQPGAETLNPSSSTQIQTLLFGGSKLNKSGGPRGKKTAEILPVRRVFKMERDPAELAAYKATEIQDEYVDYTAPMLKEKLKEKGLKTTGKKDELLARIRGQEVPDPADIYKGMSREDLQHVCVVRQLSTDGTKTQLVRNLAKDDDFTLKLNSCIENKNTVVAPRPKMTKYRDLTISSLGMTPIKFTASGAPAVSMDVLRHLAGEPNEDPPKYGPAFNHFGGGQEGKEACEALYALCNMGSVDTMVSNFLQPLQELVDERSRVHCSLNLNTETGRLSARKPNLQNQPALEKDQYKIRAAFRAEEGNTLVVADYGQLELRLLAHITDCKSMIAAFKEGGCFHSRTAVGMFDHVRKAVDDGEVLLEWDYSKGAPPKPLVKDVYASERRKAKTLNFSIAYGKTAHGLSKDWGVTLKEAENLVKAWYADRPEVKKWQEQVIQNAKDTGYSRTLMGRYRKLPDITSSDRARVSHGTRAAINTPIQGGAADVAMVAMIGIVRSPVLKELGWKLLLQVHDEVILEGPEETAEEALKETVRCMEQPWDGVGLRELRVDLLVDAKFAKTWYDAK